jgi:2-phospho-L-lactate/phosphoenolpyruvate guanylyltransferase
VGAWQIVVPVKPAGQGKSRLDADAELVAAVAIDTIQAAAQAEEVGRVIVVTADEQLAWRLGGDPRIAVVREEAATGIAAAVSLGIDTVEETQPRAVLLGDVPALKPEDLDAALVLAARVTRGYVADREGGGTTLVTATPGNELLSRFGEGSAARHSALGIVRLHVPPESTLRRDVDTREQLDAAALLGLGPATTAALANPAG